MNDLQINIILNNLSDKSYVPSTTYNITIYNLSLMFPLSWVIMGSTKCHIKK